MIDWDVVKDWAPILISAIAIFVSLVTLYISHLRGPNIKVADPGEWIIPAYTSFGPDNNEGSVDFNLLFVNIGNRSGILFDINIKHTDIIYQIGYKIPLSNILPIIILPGQGEGFKPILMTAKPSEKTWTDTLKGKEYLEIELVYKTSTSFPWNKDRRKNLRIDIRDLKEFVKQSKI
jgi:hypothetical protein